MSESYFHSPDDDNDDTDDASISDHWNPLFNLTPSLDLTIGGTVANRYRIIRNLGEGGMGIVYLAHDNELSREVALKFLSPKDRESEESRKRFFREARIAANLRHENICLIYDVNKEEIFFSMGYVPGEDVADILEREGKIQFQKALQIAVEGLSGLEYAHRQGVIHRDIKPGNIRIADDGKVVIMDFGIALSRLISTSRLTQEGHTIGTLAYMAPEQIKGDDADERSDIYSFALVLNEMLTGLLPNSGVSFMPPSHYVPEIPSSLDEIVMKALDPNPDKRYQRAGDFRRHLFILYSESDQLQQLWEDSIQFEKEGRIKQALEAIRSYRKILPGNSAAQDRMAKLEARDQATRSKNELTSASSEDANASNGTSGRQPESGSHKTPFWIWVTGIFFALITGLAIGGVYQNYFPERPTDVPKITIIMPPTKAPPDAPPSPSHTPVLASPEAEPSSADEERIVPAAILEKPNCPKDMVWIPAGKFHRGSIDGKSDEGPVAELAVDGFCIDIFEFPQNGLDLTSEKRAAGGYLPMRGVTWRDAEAICESLQKRLCSEIEWERACRGGEEYGWTYGNVYERGKCRDGSNLRAGPSPGGAHKQCANRFGLYDMSGNVAEWVADDYQSDYSLHARKPPDRPKVVRGGFWADGKQGTRCACRGRSLKETAAESIGFRCCRDMP